MNPAMITLGGISCTLYGALAGCACFAAAVWIFIRLKGSGLRNGKAFLLTLAPALCALACGRLIWALIRAEDLFYDEMGRPAGFSPFFDLSRGGLSLSGIILGLVGGVLLTSRLMHAGGLRNLDLYCVPSLAAFAVLRFSEPFFGMGYGPEIQSAFWGRAPFAIPDTGEGWLLSVSFLEGVLTAVILLILLLSKATAPGTTAFRASAMFAASQIIPVSLQRDDVLRVFTFAPVDPLGYAVMILILFVSVFAAEKRNGVSLTGIAGGITLMACCFAVIVCGEFALDKSTIPAWVIYLMMAAALGGMLAYLLKRFRPSGQEEGSGAQGSVKPAGG